MQGYHDKFPFEKSSPTLSSCVFTGKYGVLVLLDKVGLYVLSPGKSGRGRAVKKGREMTRVKQPGSKLGEASFTTQREIINILDKGISASIESKPST